MADVTEEARREVWEYLIDDLEHRAMQTKDENLPPVHNEKLAIITHLKTAYELTFGQTYPEELGRL